MSRARGRKPHRGGGGGGTLDDTNPLVIGGEGQRQPQGGAAPGPSESGSLEAREFGVPQADLPGGLRHTVNPQAKPARPPGVHERPADEHKFHGVEPYDLEGYATPEDEAGIKLADRPKPAPEPKLDDVVPVRIVETSSQRVIRKLIAAGPFSLGANDTMRIARRDPERVRLYVNNEGVTGTNRVCGSEADADQGVGMKIPNTTLVRFDSQDEVWLVNTGTAAGTMSWAYDTEVFESLSGPE